MLVSFKQIQAVYPGDVAQIQPGTSNPAMGPITGSPGGRTSLYDPVWGYFTFEQRAQCVYGEGQSYNSQGEFTVRGVFTANAETIQDDPEPTRLAALVAKLDALEEIFESAAQAAAPDAYADWGTASDARVIALPQPLRDIDGKPVYALPVSMKAVPAPFTNAIAYEAVLAEAIFPAAKVVINQTMLDNGVITIVPPQPILSTTPLVGAKGAAIGCKNYTALEISVAGTMPYTPQPGNALPARTRQFIAGLQDSSMQVKTVERQDNGSVEHVLWEDLDTDDPEVVVNYRDLVVQVGVKGK